MFTEARKLHLIEEVMRLHSEDALVQIEHIIKRSSSEKPQARPSAHKFLGKISPIDISLMNEAIKEGCEQVNPDDWK